MKRRSGILFVLSLSLAIVFGSAVACSDNGAPGDYVGLEHELIGISVGGEYKTDYTEGEKFDIAGMTVTANYADDKNETVEFGDYFYTPSGALTVADQTVTVKYSGFSYEIAVTVKPASTDPSKPDKPTDPDDPVDPIDPEKPIYPELPDPPAESENGRIVVTAKPNKTGYYIGEALDKTGLEVTHIKKDDTSEVVADYTLDKQTVKAEDIRNGKITVTVTYKDMTTEFSVEAHEPKLVSLAVNKAPDKTDYFVGDILDPSGLEVKAAYEDGGEPKAVDGYFLLIDDERDIAEYRLGLDDKTVTVVYIENGETKIAEFEINVKAPAYTKLEITVDPAVTTYLEGERFDMTGLVVSAVYENGASRRVTDYSLSIGEYTDLSAYELQLTDRQITVTYTEDEITHTVNIDITVSEAVLTGLKIGELPDKTEYMVGESFDRTGLVIYGVYNNDESLVRNLSGWDTASAALALGMTEITVRYEELTVNVPVTVLAKYIFEAEGLGVETGKPGVAPDLRYGFEYAGKDHTTVDRSIASGMGFVANMQSANAFILDVYVENDCDAVFGISYSRHSESAGSAEYVKTIIGKLTVGSEEFAIDGEAAIYGNAGGIRYLDFCETDFARIRLQKGENTIKIYTTGSSRNFDYVTVKAPVAVTLSSELTAGHDWSDYYVASAPTENKGGKIYRYCHTCMTRETVMLPPDLADESKYVKGETVDATATKNGYTEYAYNGIAFKIQKSAEYYVENRFDLENAARNEAFNTLHGIKYNTPVTDLSGKYEGAHGSSVENFATRGGGEYTWTVYAPTDVDGRLLVRILGDANEYNPSFSLLLKVNGKPVALDDGVYSEKTNGWQYLDVAGISLEQGKNTVTVQAIAGGFTYMDDVVIKCPVTIDVDESKLVKSIAVTKAPTKTVYAQGEVFNPAGMVITATRADGTTFTAENFKFDKAPLNTIGAVDIAVWAENFEITVPVTVEDIHIVALQIINNPVKTEYIEGESLDTTGLEIRAIYNDNSQAQIAIDDLTFDVTRFKGGETSVTVSVGDVSVSYNVVSKFVSRFEAEGVEWNCNVRAYPESGTESGVGRIGDWKGQTAEFGIYIEKAASADLYITFTGIEAKGAITQFVADLTVDGVSYKEQLVATFADNSWNKIYTVKLASFDLSSGDHVIKVIGASGSTAKNSNFDYITLHTTATRAVWNDEKNGKAWGDWQVMTMPTAENAGVIMRQSTHCDVEKMEIPADLNGNKYTVVAQAEPTEDEFGYTTYECGGVRFNVWGEQPLSANKNAFRAVDAVKIFQTDGGAPVHNANLNIDYYNTKSYRFILRFDLRSDKAATAKLYLELFGSAGAVKPYRALDISVNGKPIIGDRAETKITNSALSEVFFGMAELNAGKNTVVIIGLGINSEVWLHKLGFISSTNVAWQANSLAVVSDPQKTLYNENEKFDRAGLSLESRYIGYNNAVVQRSTVSDFTIDDEQNPLDRRQKYVVARSGELSVQVPIVVRDTTITGLTVKNGKVDYVLDETPDKTYLTVFAESSVDGTITLSPADYELEVGEWKTGDVSVTVSYVADTSITAEYTVHVYADYIYSVFEAEKFEISGNATVGCEYENENRKKEMTNDPKECVGTYLVNIDKPTQLTFRPYNSYDRDVYASLALRYSKRGDFVITDFIKSVTVNGEDVSLSYIAGESDGQSSGWQDFETKKPFTAQFKLVPGANEITVALVGNGVGCNLDSIAVVGAVSVLPTSCCHGHDFCDWTVYSTPDDYETSTTLVYNMYRVCDGCGAVERVFLPDYLDTEKGYTLVSSTEATGTTRGTATYTYNGKQFTVYTDQATGTINDTAFGIKDAVLEKSGEQNMPAQSGEGYNLSKGTMAKFTYNITAASDATVRLIIKTENKEYCMPGRIFRIKINGELIGNERNVFGWQGTADKYYAKDGFRYVTLATFDLKQGDNTIEISHLGAKFVSVYGVTLQSATELALR